MLVTLSAAPGRSSSESFGGRRLEAMKILVIRFRQMGDAVLATALLNSIRRSFPDAEIHFVLNSQLADLFAGHPSSTALSHSLPKCAIRRCAICGKS